MDDDELHGGLLFLYRNALPEKVKLHRIAPCVRDRHPVGNRSLLIASENRGFNFHAVERDFPNVESGETGQNIPTYNFTVVPTPIVQILLLTWRKSSGILMDSTHCSSGV